MALILNEAFGIVIAKMYENNWSLNAHNQCRSALTAEVVAFNASVT